MYFFIFALFSFMSAVFAVADLLIGVPNPPKKYGDRFYSKSFFGKWYYEKTGIRINVFYEIAAWIHTTIFACSFIISIIDIIMLFTISELIAKKVFYVMIALVLILPILYDSAIKTWWYRVKENDFFHH